MVTDSKSNVVKGIKPINQASGGGGGGSGSGGSSKTKQVKAKTSSSSSKTVTKTTTVRVKSQKKVYTLPGQKYDPPEEREPLRIFYESLSKQIPSSEMAAFWMMEHGLLSPERAKRAYERKQKRQQQLRMGTPVKSLPKLNRPESSPKQQVSKNGDVKGKRKVVYGSDDDDDFTVKSKKGRG
ncbi:hypothetical protein AQUCO_00100326v1 [Aquilegia coerulea]|uniref:Uncharacterized protein n=1 Tax=Aquilegia coerulea TaxID=218851 RepID=A0A2G5FA13_AQUCA|nr:hypothetical protein AQUCO_00100326v1 [Aquilegia coerulea]PIA64777.1 hypothetical protein AQUCO_00100326v1 [Aquilegia coerulea]